MTNEHIILFILGKNRCKKTIEEALSKVWVINDGQAGNSEEGENCEPPHSTKDLLKHCAKRLDQTSAWLPPALGHVPKGGRQCHQTTKCTLFQPTLPFSVILYLMCAAVILHFPISSLISFLLSLFISPQLLFVFCFCFKKKKKKPLSPLP